MTDDDRPLCGGPGLGDCFCDDSCESYGDCCDDFADVCVMSGEFCGNGEDDNGDGLIDCEDPQCEGEAQCYADEISSDGDDGAGDAGDDTDGDDTDGSCVDGASVIPDCNTCTCVEGNWACTEIACDGTDEPLGEFCSNGEDDNGNGLIDCDDPFCSDAPDCQPIPSEHSCADSCGDEAPGGRWCDSTCVKYEDCCVDFELFCQSDDYGEFCGNGEDDNGDGLTDCEDPDCAEEC